MALSAINNTKRFESEGEVGGLCNIKIWFKGKVVATVALAFGIFSFFLIL